MIDSRACTKCTELKLLSEFSHAPHGKHGRKSVCKACDAARHRAQFVPAVIDEVAKEARYTARRTDTKRCTQCGEEKPCAEFSKTRDGKYGPVLRSNCKPCASNRAYQWYLDNRDHAIATQRNTKMLKAYGLTVSAYNTLSEAQGHRCAVCNEPETVARGDRVMFLAIDHCHNTGRIRGLLCSNCNRAIGLLKDNVDVLRKAIDYLEGR